MLDLIEMNSYEFMPLEIQNKRFYQTQVKNLVQKIRVVKSKRTENSLSRVIEIDIGGHFVITSKIRDNRAVIKIMPVSMNLKQLADKLVCTEEIIRRDSHEIAECILNSAIADNLVDLF